MTIYDENTTAADEAMIDSGPSTVYVPAALPEGLPKKALGAITNNIVIILGVAIVLVILGSIILSWMDKTMPEAVMVMGGVALGYVGNALTNNRSE